jgi:hypothetical protein
MKELREPSLTCMGDLPVMGWNSGAFTDPAARDCHVTYPTAATPPSVARELDLGNDALARRSLPALAGSFEGGISAEGGCV